MLHALFLFPHSRQRGHHENTLRHGDRAPSGYWHCRNTIIADVLSFEREELGNEDQLPDVPETVLKQSAKHCAWVALDPYTATCYGDRVIEIELDNAIIIASDGCGGLLVYSKHIHC